ncbi:hypothetical protein BKA70DRAFT_1184565 [Coprinopsis sp. MPI-PUGE-AT-0042]|nr:hypothetical protein BKA70DRAFT_1184565 [Coprinopsis sp. MPI-PUGE-AT-0042]
MGSKLPLADRFFVLTIGIDKYLESDYPNLKGAVHDADSIEQLLLEKGVLADRIRSLRNEEATRSAIRRELTDLITNSSIQGNDPILIYFAGRAVPEVAPAEWDTWDNRVRCLVPHDYHEPDGNGGIVHGLPDHILGVILHRISKAKGRNITVILDSSYPDSNEMEISNFLTLSNDDSDPPLTQRMPGNVDADLLLGEASFPSERFYLFGGFEHRDIESHALLTACSPGQNSHETEGKGIFTKRLLSALRSLDISSTTYPELIQSLRFPKWQTPQCAGNVDRFLFSNEPRRVEPKGYYAANSSEIKRHGRMQRQTYVEAGLIHGITEDTVFDIWTDLDAISEPPHATCETMQVTPFRATMLRGQEGLQASQRLVARPRNAKKPALKYHTSENFKAIFILLLQSRQAMRHPFCLVQTTRELADVSLSKVGKRARVEFVGPGELPRRSHERRELESLDEVWDLLGATSFYYHYLRHESAALGQASRTMFDIEVYRLDHSTLNPISPNLNQPGKGVHLSIADKNNDEIYGFKCTNISQLDVYPYLFHFNSYDLSIKSIYRPASQQTDRPLKAGQSFTVNWSVGGTRPASLGVDEDTNTENGFLKLYIARDYVNFDVIEQAGFTDQFRVLKKELISDGSVEFLGTVRIPFAVERKQGGGDNDARGKEAEKEGNPLICLLGTNNAKAPLLHGLSSAIRPTEEPKGVKLHEGVEVLALLLGGTVAGSIASLPAFENDDVEKNLAVCEALFDFFDSIQQRDCHAVIMAYDLSRPRLRHCDFLNFRLIADLCGPQIFAKNLAIITTNWRSENPANAAHLHNRDSDLRSRESCFKEFLEHGAQCHRHEYTGSPSMLELLRALSASPPMPLAIQEEVTTDPAFNRTKIGRVMGQRLRDHLKLVSERSESLKAELEKILEGNWDLFDDEEKSAMERDQEALDQTRERLNRIVEEKFS